jgi:molybdopterin-binding protein
MKISARNQLTGVVRSVRKGAVMAEVVVDVDAGSVTSVITAGSVDHLALSDGDRVTVIIKATEVMVGKD